MFGNRVISVLMTALVILVFGYRTRVLPSALGTRGVRHFSKQSVIHSQNDNVMKNKLALLGILFSTHFVQAQGSFINPDFELAAVPNLPPNQSGGFVSISAAMPGWNAYVGTTHITNVLHNDYSLGGSIPSILGPISPS